MKYRGTILFYLLFLSFPLVSRDIQLQFSTAESQALLSPGFLADPLPDIHYTKDAYYSYSAYPSLASSDVIWLEIENVDFYEALSQRKDLRLFSLQKERLNLFYPCNTGLSLNIEYLEWQTLMQEKEIWLRWSQSLALLMKEQDIQYLEIYPVSEALIQSSVYPLLIDLEEQLKNQGVQLILGIQNADAATAESPFHYEIRAFDYSGKHSTLEALEEQLFLLREKAIPAERITAGIPLYGRNFNSEDQGYWFDSLPYKDIVSLYHPSIEENIQESYFYNGPSLVKQKIELCKEYGIKAVKLNRLEWDSPVKPLSLYQAALELIP